MCQVIGYTSLHQSTSMLLKKFGSGSHNDMSQLAYLCNAEWEIMEFESADIICQNKSFVKPDTPVYIKPLQNHTDNKTTDLFWIHSGKTVQLVEM